ncbi:MAG TPA: triose-phosphate isomerase, partial [Methanoregulaceae archaeon]|nr:triose-phosphate isomerase [Methanoregulaceae archaeon]
MTKAFILINLKTYSEGAGQRAHNIAGAAEQVADESGVLIALAPSYMNIHPLSMHYGLPVYAQHVDGAGPGAHTGAITAEALKMAGAVGSLVNHSERRLTLA